MFESVDSGNYREAATKKEPKFRQMPVRLKRNNISQSRKKISSSAGLSPPTNRQTRRFETPQSDIDRDPNVQQINQTSASIHISSSVRDRALIHVNDAPFSFDPIQQVAGPSQIYRQSWQSSAPWTECSSPNTSELSELPDAWSQELGSQCSDTSPMTNTIPLGFNQYADRNVATFGDVFARSTGGYTSSLMDDRISSTGSRENFYEYSGFQQEACFLNSAAPGINIFQNPSSHGEPWATETNEYSTGYSGFNTPYPAAFNHTAPTQYSYLTDYTTYV